MWGSNANCNIYKIFMTSYNSCYIARSLYVTWIIITVRVELHFRVKFVGATQLFGIKGNCKTCLSPIDDWWLMIVACFGTDHKFYEHVNLISLAAFRLPTHPKCFVYISKLLLNNLTRFFFLLFIDLNNFFRTGN